MQHSTVQSVDRTFDILELLAANPNGLSVGSVGSRLDLHKSTVSRLLQVLKHRGYVDKDPSTGQYRIGLKIIELASSQLENVELRLEARGPMQTLAQATGQTVFLAVERGTEAVYIDKTEAYDSLKRYTIIGTSVPLYCTALGKALLMEKPEAELTAFLEAANLVPRGPNTLLDPDRIKADLRTCAARGYTIDDEENEAGVRCIGAPVYDYLTRTVAAVSVSGTTESILESAAAEIGRCVREAALEISKRLGYRPGTTGASEHNDNYKKELNHGRVTSKT
jgi:IclR family transcriptional regulator, KDG regulon repressor